MTPLRVSRGRRDSQSCGNLRINLRNSSADHRKGGGSGRRPAEAERGSPPSPWAALPVPIPCASVPPPTTGAQLGNLPCPSSRPCSATPPALAGSTPSSQARPHIPLRPRSSSTLETCIARPFPAFHTVTRTSEAPGKKKKKKSVECEGREESPRLAAGARHQGQPPPASDAERRARTRLCRRKSQASSESKVLTVPHRSRAGRVPKTPRLPPAKSELRGHPRVRPHGPLRAPKLHAWAARRRAKEPVPKSGATGKDAPQRTRNASPAA